MENIVSNIKAFRKARGMTQAELAEKSNVPLSTIKQIERGVRGGSFKTVIKLYKALGIKLTITYEIDENYTEDKPNVSA